MDPLSLTASIITIVGVGGKFGKAMARVRALKNAPAIFLALNNEIADLHYVVQDVDDVLRRHSDIVGTIPARSLCRALEKSKSTLSSFERLVSYQLTTVDGKENHARLDRSAWLRAEKKVQRVMNDIREDKINLSNALTILNAWVLSTY